MRRADSIARFARWISTALLFTVSAARAENGEPSPSTKAGVSNDEAVGAFWKGKEYYDAGQYAQALDQFGRAYSLTNDAELLYDIAQTYRALGQCEPALKSYQDYLRAEPQSPLAAMAQRQVERLQGDCQRPSEQRRPEAIQAGAQGTTTAAPVSNAVQVGPNDSTARHLDTSEDKSTKTTRVLTLVTLSGGVLAGGIATGLAIWNENRDEQWTSTDRTLKQGLAPGETPSDWLNRQRTNNDLGRSIQRTDKETLALSLGAVALVATSAVLYLWRPGATNRRREAITRALELTPQPGMYGSRSACMSVSVTF